MSAMSKFEDFRSLRWFRLSNRLVQVCLSLVLFGALNYLATHYFWRQDITESRQYSLSPESLAHLRQIEDPVNIIVTVSPDEKNEDLKKVYEDLKSLLREYEYALNGQGEVKVKVEFVNLFQQRKRAEELAAQYNIQRENVIVVACADRHREILGTDLYEGTPETGMLFKGEQAFTSAIVDVCSKQRQKIYFIQGHGEMSPDDVNPLKGISQAAQLLQQYNIELSSINLSHINEVPEDADLLLLVGPQVPLLSHEEEKLRRYLDKRSGRMAVFLTPTKDHGLEDLFYDWGILAEDRILIDTGKDFQSSSGDFLIRRFAEHPVTQMLIDYQVGILTGLCRPVILDTGATPDERRTTMLLMGSSEGSWAKYSYQNTDDLLFNPRYDVPGPVGLGAVSEIRVGSELGLNIPGGRLIVFGNADFIANHRFDTLGNKMLFLNTINWSLGRSNMLNIPPRKVENFQIILSQQEILNLGGRLFLVPLSFAFLGFGVAIVRRRS
tara:strand:+ start:11800 stop:13287 length:1488 start_codon:yes stop_codon:yes gene_type:complete